MENRQNSSNSDKHRASLSRLEKLSFILDDLFRIPGTRRRFGLDGLVGLIPGAGDAATSLLSLYLIWEARRMGAPKPTQARMLGNIVLDTLVGSIPLFGDVFDVGFKANRKNLRLLKKHLNRRNRSF
ncbi:MAG: DUF4112 domain-containing protein [Desulfobacterales bacterium]